MKRKYVFGFILSIIPIYIHIILHGFIRYMYKENRIAFDVLFSQRFRIGLLIPYMSRILIVIVYYLQAISRRLSGA